MSEVLGETILGDTGTLISGQAAVELALAGRRERKKLATRKQLRAAALELVAARGLAAVTVEDIAELADVSTRTFFNYFPTKEAAVVAIEPAERDRLQHDLLELPADLSPLEALRSVILGRVKRLMDEVDEFGEDRATWLRRYQACKADPDLHMAWVAQMCELERLLSETLANRMGRPLDDPFAALVTSTVLAAMRVAAIHWTALGGEASYSEIARAAIDTLGSGLHDDDRFANVLASERRRGEEQSAKRRQAKELLKSATKEKVSSR